MAKQFLTALDLAARRGTDKEIGLVQQIVNYAPEVQLIMGRPIPGTFTEAKVQVGITKGGAFRAFNSGVIPGAGQYERRRFDAFFFDSQLEVDEAELIAANQIGDSLGDLQSDEVNGALQDKAIKFSQQFYGGLGLNADGFPGLIDLLNIYAKVIDSRTGKPIVNVIDAGGAGNNATSECVWYVWVHQQAVHFLFGGNQVINVNPWQWQYVQDQADPKKRRRASVSNISGFIGLACAHPWGVTCIKNIDATHAWTDALSAKLHALLPAGITPTHCFATKRARGGLQQSRTVTLFGSGTVKPDQGTVAPIPQADVSGVPIHVTDGIQLIKPF
jgi:hypothetical protein